MARYSLNCVDCARDTCPSSAKPRVPLCTACKSERQKRAREAAKRRHPSTQNWSEI